MAPRIISCAPGAHIGEQIALGFLKENLQNGIILTNFHQPDITGTLEVDLLVINYRGVWLLEVKHWWGKILADPIHWLHAGRKHPSPLTTIEKKAKMVHGALADEGMGDTSVVGLVVLSKGTAALEIEDQRADRVFGLNEDLIEAITGEDYLFSPHSPTLRSTQIDRICNALIRKHVDPEWRIVGSYRLVQELGGGERCQVFEGQHISVQNRRARIKRYEIDAIQSRDHLKQSIRLFKQDVEALTQLEGHPNIVGAYDFMHDPDTDAVYWLLLEYVEGETLEQRLQQTEPVSLDQQYSYLASITEALEYCHGEGILHRNLTPSAIWVTPSGEVRLGDFDFARVPALGFTISETGVPLVTNKFIAPEQLANPRQADHRADLYSLGAIWYEMAFLPPRDEPILVHQIEQSDLQSDAKEFMKSLLANRADDRPDSASEAREWFELLRK